MTLLLLVGCLRATSDAPFELGRLRTALVLPEGDTALVLLTDAELTCGRLASERDNQVDEDQTILWNDRGVMLQLWFEEGLEGLYVQGAVPLNEPRIFLTTAFDRGEVWQDNHPATLDLSAEGEGDLDGQWVKASFRAEICPEG